ncbi:hypothetical protein Tco_1337690 [Tanacetum coccineum]
MDDPNITMEEYNQLEEEKARRRAIIYNDALTSKTDVSSEPTVSTDHVNKVDFDFEISFFESDDEDYTVIYDNDSFLYKIFSTIDLKSD